MAMEMGWRNRKDGHYLRLSRAVASPGHAAAGGSEDDTEAPTPTYEDALELRLCLSPSIPPLHSVPAVNKHDFIHYFRLPFLKIFFLNWKTCHDNYYG